MIAGAVGVGFTWGTALLRARGPDGGRTLANRAVHELNIALAAAIRDGDVDRVLRLAINNIPRFPHALEVRRAVATAALIRGEPQIATAVIGAVARLASATGDLLYAVESCAMLENMKSDFRGVRDKILAQVVLRGFGRTPELDADGAPDTDGKLPAGRSAALMREAYELAVELPSVSTRTLPFRPISLLPELEPEVYSWAMRNVRLVVRKHGDPLVDEGTVFAGWITSGTVDIDGAMHMLPCGTFVYPPDNGESPIVVGGVRMLSLNAEEWATFAKLPGVATEFERVRWMERLLRAVRESQLFSTLSPERSARILAAAEAQNAEADAEVAAEGSGRVFMLIKGHVEVSADPGDGAEAYKPGDVFGDLERDEVTRMSGAIVAQDDTELVVWDAVALAQMLSTDADAPAADDALTPS